MAGGSARRRGAKPRESGHRGVDSRRGGEEEAFVSASRDLRGSQCSSGLIRAQTRRSAHLVVALADLRVVIDVPPATEDILPKAVVASASVQRPRDDFNVRAHVAREVLGPQPRALSHHLLGGRGDRNDVRCAHPQMIPPTADASRSARTRCSSAQRRGLVPVPGPPVTSRESGAGVPSGTLKAIPQGIWLEARAFFAEREQSSRSHRAASRALRPEPSANQRAPTWGRSERLSSWPAAPQTFSSAPDDDRVVARCQGRAATQRRRRDRHPISTAWELS